MGFAKKVVLGALVAGGAVAAFSGTRALTHVRHEVGEVRAWADSKIPMDKKLQLLREETNDLERQVDRVKTELAREIVETRELTDATGKLSAKIVADRKDPLARGTSISEGDKQVGTAGRQGELARARLERDVAAHQHDLARLASLEATLANRADNRDTLQQTLDATVGQKDMILAEIGAVEADYKRLQLEQVKSKFQTDGTKLAGIKERLRQLKKQIEVQKVRHELEPQGREVPVAVGPARSVEEILKPLTEARPTGDVK